MIDCCHRQTRQYHHHSEPERIPIEYQQVLQYYRKLYHPQEQLIVSICGSRLVVPPLISPSSDSRSCQRRSVSCSGLFL